MSATKSTTPKLKDLSFKGQKHTYSDQPSELPKETAKKPRVSRYTRQDRCVRHSVQVDFTTPNRFSTLQRDSSTTRNKQKAKSPLEETNLRRTREEPDTKRLLRAPPQNRTPSITTTPCRRVTANRTDRENVIQIA